jgi:hypothetical protein
MFSLSLTPSSPQVSAIWRLLGDDILAIIIDETTKL